MSSFQQHALPRGLALTVSALLRAVLAVAGLVMLIGVMVFAITFAAVVIAWALVRGRRPQAMRFDWRGFGKTTPFRRGASTRSESHGEVVDVEVREVSTRAQR
jgi:hypothetical protein